MYKKISELNKMSVEDIVKYVDFICETDEDAICNMPVFQNWCLDLCELDNFEKVAEMLGWEV